MSIIPWKRKQRQGGEHAVQPTRSLEQFRSEVDRMMDRFLAPAWGHWPAPFDGWHDGAPALDLSESPTEYTVRIELPGVEPKDLEVTLANNTLTISGSKQETKEHKEGKTFRSECSYGSFSRSVALPQEVDAAHVSAEHSRGVLTIKLKKVRPSQVKRIPVK